MKTTTTKNDVTNWETVATHHEVHEGELLRFYTQIGEAEGVWYIRTNDDYSGEDTAQDTAYPTEEAATLADEEYAESNNEMPDAHELAAEIAEMSWWDVDMTADDVIDLVGINAPGAMVWINSRGDSYYDANNNIERIEGWEDRACIRESAGHDTIEGALLSLRATLSRAD